MDLKKLGVFCFLDGLTGPQVKQFAQKVEKLDYSALWFTEVTGRESFSFGSYLLSQTERLIVATGVAIVFKRERIAAHYQAGASHVCVLPLSEQGTAFPDERVLEVLAPG